MPCPVENDATMVDEEQAEQAQVRVAAVVADQARSPIR